MRKSGRAFDMGGMRLRQPAIQGEYFSGATFQPNAWLAAIQLGGGVAVVAGTTEGRAHARPSHVFGAERSSRPIALTICSRNQCDQLMESTALGCPPTDDEWRNAEVLELVRG